MRAEIILFFVILTLISSIYAVAFFVKTKNIPFFSVNTDNEKLLRQAVAWKFNSFPSLMHEFPAGRAQNREFYVIALKIFGLFFTKLRLKDQLNILVAVTSHTLSTLLIYKITLNWIEPVTALLISLVYLTNSWSYQVAIYMGHTLLAQFFFLLSILFLTEMKSLQSEYLIISSVMIGISFFSSSASRKYFQFWCISLLYFVYIENKNFFYFLILNFMILTFAKNIFSRSIFDNYRIRGYRFFFNMLSHRIPIDILSRKDILLWLQNLFLNSVFLIMNFVSVFLIFGSKFMIFVFYCVLGFLIVALYLWLPNPVGALNRFRIFYDIANWANHFRGYIGTFGDSLGLYGKNSFKGPPNYWIIRYLSLINPFFFPIILLTISCIFFVNLKLFLAFLIVCLLPFLSHIISKGIAVGKSYFPITNIYIFSCITLSIYFETKYLSFLIVLFALLLFGQIIFNKFILFPSVIGARTGIPSLIELLHNQGITEISTYSNAFSDSLGRLISRDYPNSVRVFFIDSVNASRTRYFLIPNRSFKALQMESTAEGINGVGLEKLDSSLTALLNNSNFQSKILFKFATTGSSKFFMCESEVTCYRFLIRKEFDKVEIEKTYALLVDLGVKES